MSRIDKKLFAVKRERRRSDSAALEQALNALEDAMKSAKTIDGAYSADYEQER